jgi:hypothetical protein
MPLTPDDKWLEELNQGWYIERGPVMERATTNEAATMKC